METTSEKPLASTASTGPPDPEACDSPGKSFLAPGANMIDSRQQPPSVDAATKPFGSSQIDGGLPRSAKDLRDSGQALAMQCHYEGAAAKFREALELEPDDPDSYRAYSALADALAKVKRFGEAAQYCEEAVAIGEKAQSGYRRIVLRSWGRVLTEREDYEGAAAKLREALELEPDDADSYRAYYALAYALAQA